MPYALLVAVKLRKLKSLGENNMHFDRLPSSKVLHFDSAPAPGALDVCEKVHV